jgi:hypothetical protein
MKKIGIIILLAFLGFTSCTNNKWELIAPKTPPVPCDTTGTISYATTIVPILNANCGTTNNNCHSPSAPSLDPNLSTYAGVQGALSHGVLLNDITWSPNAANNMPKSPNPKLSDCNISLIQKWINAGAPNN